MKRLRLTEKDYRRLKNFDYFYEVNAGCSSRLPEIKKDEISEDEKVGQRRCNKEDHNRIVSSTVVRMRMRVIRARFR